MRNSTLRERRRMWRGQVWPHNRWRLKCLKRDREAQLLVKCVAASRRVPLYDLLDGRRGLAAVCEARHLAMYLVHVLLGRPQEAVGHLFGRRGSAVSYACQVIEDRREAKALDAEIDAIERQFTQMLEKEVVDAG